MLVLNSQDVRKCLPMKEMIEATKRVFAAFSTGQAQAPLRSRLEKPDHDGETLIMPGYLRDEEGEALAVKVTSIFPHNVQKGIPIIHAIVMALEPDTGRVMAVLDGTVLNAIRTGAASGVATDLLSRFDSRITAIFGAGMEARTQLEAVCAVRAIETVWVYARTPEHVQTFIQEMKGKGSIPKDVRAASNPQQAARDADIICAATTSATPVFDDADVRQGAHINGVGSYNSGMQEVPAGTVARAMVVVDSLESALVEAGDIIQPIQQGIIQKEHIHAELGEIVLGTKEGRTDPKQVTFFKSVGLAVQDVVAARLALQNARLLGLGEMIKW